MGGKAKQKYDANGNQPTKFYFFRIALYKYGHLYSLNQYFSISVRINMVMNTDYIKDSIVYNRTNTLINTDEFSFFQLQSVYTRINTQTILGFYHFQL